MVRTSLSLLSVFFRVLPLIFRLLTSKIKRSRFWLWSRKTSTQGFLPFTMTLLTVKKELPQFSWKQYNPCPKLCWPSGSIIIAVESIFSATAAEAPCLKRSALFASCRMEVMTAKLLPKKPRLISTQKWGCRIPLSCSIRFRWLLYQVDYCIEYVQSGQEEPS